MNKYIIPICDASDDARCWIEIILARSIPACQEKLMERLLNKFSYLEDTANYDNFKNIADKNNIIIGKIIDIEEI